MLGDVLRRHRLRAGLTQQELAGRAALCTPPIAVEDQGRERGVQLFGQLPGDVVYQAQMRGQPGRCPQ